MIRFYILPIEEISNARGPKYIKWQFNPGGIQPQRYSMKDYGLINAALIAIEFDQAQHEQLVAEPDVAAAPENLDNNISEVAIPQVQAVLEALRIPAGWVDSTHTYREILRMVGGLFMFAQRHNGLHGEDLIDNQAQLNLRWNEIPGDRQDRILVTADNMGYDWSEVENSWLIRRVLKHLADQWGDTPILFGFVTL
jgi:hypothetical protein